MTKPISRIIFECIGETSKDIMGTAVVSALKREYPKADIIVNTTHTEVWLHNPNVYRVYKLGTTAYFYDDYVADGKSLIFKLDPYNSNDFILGETHLIDAWCELCGIERKGAMPELFFTHREKEIAREALGIDKPVLLIHLHGEIGGMPYPYPWSRDANIPGMQKIVDLMSEKGYSVVQVTPPNTPTLRGVKRLVFDNRLMMCAIMHTSKRILVDSFLQHAAAAFDLPSVVLWNSLDPERHGYGLHKNVIAKKSKEYAAHEDLFIGQFRLTRALPAQNPVPPASDFYTPVSIVSALEKT